MNGDNGIRGGKVNEPEALTSNQLCSVDTESCSQSINSGENIEEGIRPTGVAQLVSGVTTTVSPLVVSQFNANVSAIECDGNINASTFYNMATLNEGSASVSSSTGPVEQVSWPEPCRSPPSSSSSSSVSSLTSETVPMGACSLNFYRKPENTNKSSNSNVDDCSSSSTVLSVNCHDTLAPSGEAIGTSLHSLRHHRPAPTNDLWRSRPVDNTAECCASGTDNIRHCCNIGITANVLNDIDNDLSDDGYMDDMMEFLTGVDGVSHGSTVFFNSASLASRASCGASVNVGPDEYGDFIETDIPRRNLSTSSHSSRSNDSRTSSCEELAVAVARTDNDNILTATVMRGLSANDAEGCCSHDDTLTRGRGLYGGSCGANLSLDSNNDAEEDYDDGATVNAPLSTTLNEQCSPSVATSDQRRAGDDGVNVEGEVTMELCLVNNLSRDRLSSNFTYPSNYDGHNNSKPANASNNRGASLTSSHATSNCTHLSTSATVSGDGAKNKLSYVLPRTTNNITAKSSPLPAGPSSRPPHRSPGRTYQSSRGQGPSPVARCPSPNGKFYASNPQVKCSSQGGACLDTGGPAPYRDSSSYVRILNQSNGSTVLSSTRMNSLDTSSSYLAPDLSNRINGELSASSTTRNSAVCNGASNLPVARSMDDNGDNEDNDDDDNMHGADLPNELAANGHAAGEYRANVAGQAVQYGAQRCRSQDNNILDNVDHHASLKRAQDKHVDWLMTNAVSSDNTDRKHHPVPAVATRCAYFCTCPAASCVACDCPCHSTSASQHTYPLSSNAALLSHKRRQYFVIGRGGSEGGGSAGESMGGGVAAGEGRRVQHKSLEEMSISSSDDDGDDDDAWCSGLGEVRLGVAMTRPWLTMNESSSSTGLSSAPPVTHSLRRLEAIKNKHRFFHCTCWEIVNAAATAAISDSRHLIDWPVASCDIKKTHDAGLDACDVLSCHGVATLPVRISSDKKGISSLSDRPPNNNNKLHNNNSNLTQVDTLSRPASGISDYIRRCFKRGFSGDIHRQRSAINRLRERAVCGATAVMEVLKKLRVCAYDATMLCDLMHLNYAPSTQSLTQYLLSASIEGTPAEQIIDHVSRVTSGEVYGKFFSMFPARNVKINDWLHDWMDRGAVPLATLNAAGNSSSTRNTPPTWADPVNTPRQNLLGPDVWYHQVIYNIDDVICTMDSHLRGTRLDELTCEVCAPSMLIIPRDHITSRWTDQTDLNVLLTQPNTRWLQLNVLGAVVNVLREKQMVIDVGGYRPQQTSHITIPTHYRAGITLFVRTGTDVHTRLVNTPSALPLLENPNPSSSMPFRNPNPIRPMAGEHNEVDIYRQRRTWPHRPSRRPLRSSPLHQLSHPPPTSSPINHDPSHPPPHSSPIHQPSHSYPPPPSSPIIRQPSSSYPPPPSSPIHQQPSCPPTPSPLHQQPSFDEEVASVFKVLGSSSFHGPVLPPSQPQGDWCNRPASSSVLCPPSSLPPSSFPPLALPTSSLPPSPLPPSSLPPSPLPLSSLPSSSLPPSPLPSSSLPFLPPSFHPLSPSHNPPFASCPPTSPTSSFPSTTPTLTSPSSSSYSSVTVVKTIGPAAGLVAGLGGVLGGAGAGTQGASGAVETISDSILSSASNPSNEDDSLLR